MIAGQMEFQTRSEQDGINFHHTLQSALEYADVHKTVWKISFTIPNTDERVRLVRILTDNRDMWVYESLASQMQEIMEERATVIRSGKFRK